MVFATVAVCGGALGLSLLSWIYTRATAPGFRVADKHVFVTGGSSGLGLAIAKKYAAAHAKVTIVGRNAGKLNAAKREIESWASNETHRRHPVLALQCDITDFEAVQDAIARANAFHSRVTDHVICNAGVTDPGLLLDHDLDVYRRIMDANFFGALHTVKAALPAMIASPLPRNEAKRRIVFVSSVAALTTFIGYSAYSSSKYAMRGLSDALRNELKLYDVEISIFYPGNIDTPLLHQDMPKKPAAATTIDSFSRVVSADSAAAALVSGIASGQYAITNGFLFEMARVFSNGVAPRTNTPLEIALLPLLVVVQSGFLWFYDFVVRTEAAKNDSHIDRRKTS